MLTERQRQLLLQLSDGFKNGKDLLMSRAWQSENDVTSDECFELSHLVSRAVRTMVNSGVPPIGGQP
jgi:hypothetical protein